MKILSGLAEGQVLQRLGRKGASVVLTGKAAEAGPVIVSVRQSGQALRGWAAKKAGVSRGGKFSVKLSGLPAGGSYELRLRVGKDETTVRSFYVGDVWILAGQSNMEGSGQTSNAAAPHPLVRAFTMRREWRQGVEPMHHLPESPDSCHHGLRQVSPKEAEAGRRVNYRGAGPALYFAREMVKRTGVPQGLICTAHGGTSMSQWDPALRGQKGASLYYSMLQSVRATSQPVAGMLWYQGESDAVTGAAALYRTRMKTLVRKTRQDLGQARLPWIAVQLSRYVVAGDARDWNHIQEDQRRLPEILPNFETVPAIDLPLDDPIHVGGSGLKTLGGRLANAASRLVFRDKSVSRPPQLAAILEPKFDKTRGWSQDVRFTSLQGALQSHGEPLGFSFVNAGHKDVPTIYHTTLHGSTVRLHLSECPEGLRLGYGLGLNPVCTITDESGCSLPVFGPVTVGKPRALLPFVENWLASGILPAGNTLIPKTCPDLQKVKLAARPPAAANGFIDEHPRWEAKEGQAFFSATLTLADPMHLKFLMGYDGPFALWVDGKSLFRDEKGTNPALPDSAAISAKLKAGKHTLTVAMNLNEGMAWGFFLRFERLDVTKKQLREGSFLKPEYGV